MSDRYQYIGSELEVFAGAVHWKRYFGAQLRSFIQGDVLEVGAGLGGTTKMLCHEEVDSWTCLEPDPILAEQLRAEIAHESPLGDRPIQVTTGTLTEVPAGALFDTLLYIDVLEHIENDRVEMLVAAQHLSPRGHLIVLSPAHNWLFSPFDEAIGHFRRYTRASLRDAAPQQLELVRLRYLDAVGLLASLANRTVLRSGNPTKSQIRFWDTCMVPLSRLVDPLLGYRVGKSVIGVWRLAESTTGDQRANP
jgi:2-polyprenyl-3-methyl-5-hydroxy-6-metoxy-1,4-benzoquinol methylase